MIELKAVSKNYGAHPAVQDLSLHIATGELVVLVGPSGSGKSTTLRMLNRLVECDQGQILLGGQDIRTLPPEALRRRMGYAIQSVGLFPHWTVEKNIGTVPRLLGWPEDKVRARVVELLALLQLDPQFARRYPNELSGGQQQRVGVARALAGDPEILLMDEPFGALDPVTRVDLQRELMRIHQLSGKTIVLVTHDIDEALYLADRMVVFNAGRVVQQGTPLELLTRPTNDFVTDFLGRAERGLKRLALGTVRQKMRGPDQTSGEPIAADLNLREAVSAFVVQGRASLPVVDDAGAAVGVLHFADLLDPQP
ncbi:ABC transporter ATP-binding protein [Rhodoferax saidenbachensis]|uniref:ATP-binding protein n=1 Tax=Rhodoferax saidenbachensis TaxID=1484693 RepID=A0A1P8K5A4_9BURK|nr:ABC transporter ATP-binding protein [Rhodoferax saidenbachensis]APW41179.1 ATP-binding protein [Rhodoferax saidenbachensis]